MRNVVSNAAPGRTSGFAADQIRSRDQFENREDAGARRDVPDKLLALADEVIE
jgi:hypothetical protein